jgi:hypothetical protein
VDHCRGAAERPAAGRDRGRRRRSRAGGTSNEIGAFESGLAAGLLGVVPSVLLGGSVTLLVVALVALRLPEVRRLNLDEVTELDSPDSPGDGLGPAQKQDAPPGYPSRQTA